MVKILYFLEFEMKEGTWSESLLYFYEVTQATKRIFKHLSPYITHKHFFQNLFWIIWKSNRNTLIEGEQTCHAKLFSVNHFSKKKCNQKFPLLSISSICPDNRNQRWYAVLILLDISMFSYLYSRIRIRFSKFGRIRIRSENQGLKYL